MDVATLVQVSFWVVSVCNGRIFLHASGSSGGHCFCIGCFGCSLSSSFSCPTCREPLASNGERFDPKACDPAGATAPRRLC